MAGKNDKGMSSAELSSFCGQVALILEAGLPLYDGMETLAEADSGSANAQMYQEVSKGVTETGSLYDALKADKRWPSYLVEMAGVGERSGQLEQVMRGLEEYYAREDRIRSAITGAVTYPLVLGSMLVVIVLIMLWKVLPVFRRVLASMGTSMSGSGGMLMNAGAAVGWIVLILVAAAVAAVIAALVMMRTSRGEKVRELVWKVVPAIRSISKKLSASRVAGILSMMISGGFPMDEALEMTSHVLTDAEAAKKVEEVRSGMEEGKLFADALGDTGLFGDLEQRMIRMGSATGREDQVLKKVAALYEEQAENEIGRTVSIIEPTLVALLSIVIGGVLLSVMLPMAGILSTL